MRSGVDVSAAVDMLMGAIYCRLYTGIDSQGYLVDSILRILEDGIGAEHECPWC